MGNRAISRMGGERVSECTASRHTDVHRRALREAASVHRIRDYSAARSRSCRRDSKAIWGIAVIGAEGLSCYIRILTSGSGIQLVEIALPSKMRALTPDIRDGCNSTAPEVVLNIEMPLLHV